ncbi:hypothetical protein BC826DRAFT_460828 [Russula brevipes]|nr:hypothetical protein BC826DRAFT_460828 [Russula brevipes]
MVERSLEQILSRRSELSAHVHFHSRGLMLPWDQGCSQRSGVREEHFYLEETDAHPSTADQASGSHFNPMAAQAAAHTARIHQSRQYTQPTLALSQTTATPSTSPLAANISVLTALPSSSQTSPTLRRTLTSVKSEPSLRSGVSRLTQEHEAVPRPSTSSKQACQVGFRFPHRVQCSRMHPHRYAYLPVTARHCQVVLSPSQDLRPHSPNNKPLLEVQGLSQGNPLTQVSSLPPESAPGASFGRSGSLRSKISLSVLVEPHSTATAVSPVPIQQHHFSCTRFSILVLDPIAPCSAGCDPCASSHITTSVGITGAGAQHKTHDDTNPDGGFS